MAMHDERDLFATGDYSFWSRIFEPSSEALIDAARVLTGDRVLDVASGNGNTALAAARRGANVTALDLSPAQIERGRSRSLMDGKPLTWVEGDAGLLPFRDGSFDCAFNSFGDVIVLEEMLRVVQPGGVVGITEWTGESFVGAMTELYEGLGLYASLEPGAGAARSGPRWGQEDYVRARLAPHTDHIDIRRQVITARFESVKRLCDELAQKDPYVHEIHEQLSSEQLEGLSEGLRRLVAGWNRADDDGLLLDLSYLLTVAHKP